MEGRIRPLVWIFTALSILVLLFLLTRQGPSEAKVVLPRTKEPDPPAEIEPPRDLGLFSNEDPFSEQPNPPASGRPIATTIHVFDVPESFADGFAPRPSTPAPVARLGGVLSPPQLQFLLEQLREMEDVESSGTSHLDSRGGERGIVDNLGRGTFELLSEVGADGSTLDLQLTTGSKEDSHKLTTAITIWDGQTLLVFEPGSDPGRVRTSLITTKLGESP